MDVSKSTMEQMGVVIDHPAFKDGTLSNRQGEPYNPANVPNTPEATDYLSQFPGALPGVAAQPAVEQTQPAADPAQPAEAAPQARPEPSRLFAGKYRSVEDLEKGYDEAHKALRDREAKLRAVEAVRNELEPLLGGFRREREQPQPALNRIPIQFDPQTGAPYVSPEVFNPYIEARAREVAMEQAREVLTPITRLNDVNNTLRSEYPEFGQREQAFAAYLRDNEEVRDRIAKDPEYLETAYLKFDRQSGDRVRQQTVETTRQAQDTVNAAKQQSSAGAGGVGGGRRVSELETRDAQIRALRKQAEETGDYRGYVKARLEQAVNTGGHLDALDRSGWGR